MVRHWWRERAMLKGMKAAQAAGGDGLAGGARANGKVAPVPDLALATATDQAIHDSQAAILADAPRASHWRKSIVVNGLGAVATFVVLVVFVTTKFVHGAWIVCALVPLLVLAFRSIHAHYVSVARQLSTEGLEGIRPIRHTVVVPISGIHRGVIGALEYAKAISPRNVRAVYVDIDEEATRKLREKWEQWGAGVKLVVLPSPYRSLTRPLLRYLRKLRDQGRVEIVTVVLPEFVPARWWQHLLHNQSSLLLKGALLFKRGIIVTSVPYHLEK
jgi:hypothetical protein